MPKLACLLLLAATGLIGGCVAPPMTDLPIPVVNAGPNPSPVRGYRVRCGTVPTPGWPITGNFSSGCQQYFEPGYRAVVRAKG